MAVALLASPGVTACEASSFTEDAFAAAILIALGLCAAVAVTAFVGAVQRRSARALLPILPAAGVAIATFIPVIHTIENCLA
jgi:hypothetical protein